MVCCTFSHVIAFQGDLTSHHGRAQGCEVSLLPIMLSKVDIPTRGSILVLVGVCPFNSSPDVQSLLVKTLLWTC